MLSCFPSHWYQFGSLYSFPLWSCLGGDSPSYIGMGVVHLCLCHVDQTIISFQHTNNEHFHFQQVVWWHKSQPCIPPLEISQSHWIQVTNWNNALIIIQAAPPLPGLCHGAFDALLLIMCAIIETKGLSKSILIMHAIVDRMIFIKEDGFMTKLFIKILLSNRAIETNISYNRRCIWCLSAIIC